MAQSTGSIRGFITDDASAEPLLGVNATLSNAAGAFYGSASDGDGFYQISRVPGGSYDLKVSFIGYLDFTQSVTITAGEIFSINVALSEDQALLDEVVVEGQRDAGSGATTAGLQSVRPIDIQRVPTPGVSADLAGLLTTLPGVVSSGDRGGQLFIRGGTPSQNAVFVDGMQIFQPFHILGFFSAFPSDIVREADIYAGGFGAKFGGRLSSVIDVSTRGGNKQKFAGSASFSPFLASSRIEGPIIPGRLSFITSVRESFVDKLGPQLVDQELPYRFGDRFGKLDAFLTENSRLSVTVMQTHDSGILVTEEDGAQSRITDDSEVGWDNFAVGGRYLLLPANLPVLAEILITHSRMENRFGPKSKPERVSSISRTGGEANIRYFLGGVDINTGLSVYSQNLDNQLGGQFQDLQDQTEFITEAGAYIEADVKIWEGFNLTGGARLQAFPSIGSTSLEPRAKAIWKVGSHQFSAATGIYSQQIIGLNDRRDAGDIFTAWTPAPLGFSAPKAIHYILGYKIKPNSSFEFSIEGFAKSLQDLVIGEWTALPRFTTRLQPAEGSVKGVDLRAEFDAGFFYSYINYGYNRVDYTATQESLELWFGTSELEFSPSHDRRHQINALVSFKYSGFDLNVRWQLGSGLPFSRAVGFDQWILQDEPVDSVNVAQIPGELRVLYGLPNDARLPFYHRLDVSLEKTFAIRPKINATMQVGAINTYNRPNLFYLDLFTLRRVNQLPIIPSFGFRLDIL